MAVGRILTSIAFRRHWFLAKDDTRFSSRSKRCLCNLFMLVRRSMTPCRRPICLELLHELTCPLSTRRSLSDRVNTESHTSSATVDSEDSSPQAFACIMYSHSFILSNEVASTDLGSCSMETRTLRQLYDKIYVLQVEMHRTPVVTHHPTRVLVSQATSRPNTSYEFEAEVMILHHPG